MKPSQLIASQANWTQGVSALDSDNYEVTPNNPKACKWCLLGALIRCLDGTEFSKAVNAVRAKLVERGYIATLWVYNDNHTHAEVVALLVECGY